MSETTINIENQAAYSDRQIADFLIQKCIEAEFQFSVYTKKSGAHIGFHKGVHSIWIIGEKSSLEINDSGGGLFNKHDEDSLRGALMKALIDKYKDKQRADDHWRFVESNAIKEYLSIRFNLSSYKKVTLVIHQPGRNGTATATGVSCYRKDW